MIMHTEKHRIGSKWLIVEGMFSIIWKFVTRHSAPF